MIAVCNGCRRPCDIVTREVEDWVEYGDRLVTCITRHESSDCCGRDFHHVPRSHEDTAFVCTACLRVGPTRWERLLVDHEHLRARVSCCCGAEVERRDVA